jgi:leader peptidase (prepilin peptidase)/N-methyltransferase
MSKSDCAETFRLLDLGATLGTLAVWDLSERRIPNRIVLPSTVLCFLLDAVAGIDLRALTAGMTIVAVLLLFALTQPRALGMGDVKLALLVSAGLPTAATLALVVGLLLGATCGCTLAVMRRRSLNEIALPLGPFLALGALVALL